SGAALTNPTSLVVFGGACSGSSNGIKLGTSTMNVYGDAYINSANVGGCTSMYLNGGTWSAGSTKMLTGGTCAVGGSSVCPTITSYTPEIADPYATVVAPTTAGQPAQSGCPGGTAQPGVYAATLTVS